jgi:hypothetical protein
MMDPLRLALTRAAPFTLTVTDRPARSDSESRKDSAGGTPGCQYRRDAGEHAARPGCQ